mmetsp:Transcript_19631/g.50719  ORF Transcript_19631/g.50719 Transcript_19631/m.50719 type:complete len:336 (+) Transcript_19631:359-1366(+)
MVGGRRRLLVHHLHRREVVLELDGRQRIHRLLVRGGVHCVRVRAIRAAVQLLAQLGDDLVVVHEGAPGGVRDERQVVHLRPPHVEDLRRAACAELLLVGRASEGQVVQHVRRVHQIGRVRVLGGVQPDVHRAGHLLHHEHPRHLARLGPVLEGLQRGEAPHLGGVLGGGALVVGHVVPLRVRLQELEDRLDGARGAVGERVVHRVVRVQEERGERADVHRAAELDVRDAVDGRHLDVLAVVQVGQLRRRRLPDRVELAAPVAPRREEVDENHVMRAHVVRERRLGQRDHLAVRVAVHIEVRTHVRARRLRHLPLLRRRGALRLEIGELVVRGRDV